MGAGKWIGGILGFMTMGPLGALAGFALGSLLDGNNGLFGNTYEKGQAEAGNYDEGQRNSFLFSMLVMASYIIRADGRIMHSEMEYVRQFLRMNFGEEAVIQGEQILLNLFEGIYPIKYVRVGNNKYQFKNIFTLSIPFQNPQKPDCADINIILSKCIEEGAKPINCPPTL